MNKFGRVYKRIVMVGFVRFGLMEQRVAQGCLLALKILWMCFIKVRVDVTYG